MASKDTWLHNIPVFHCYVWQGVTGTRLFQFESELAANVSSMCASKVINLLN